MATDGDGADAEPALRAEVAVDRPGRDAYTYAVPPELAGEIREGQAVVVPYGRQRVRGFVVELHRRDAAPGITLKAIGKLRSGLRMPPHLLRLIRWAARYYRCHLGTFLAGAVPAPVRQGVAIRPQRFVVATGREAELTRRQREVLELLGRQRMEFAAACRLAACSPSVIQRLVAKGALALEEHRHVAAAHLQETAPRHPLTGEQEAAVTAVASALAEPRHETFLLYGVTGSGKTFVYLELAERVIADGRQVLLLLPEIALTPQLAGRFRSRFGKVAIWHSGFSDGERSEQWRRVAEGEVDLVVGTRSALFAPLARPGLIVVDEEHDQSYKQDADPRYQARDLAVVYGRELGVPVVLGSATPSLESYHNAKRGRYRSLALRQRPGGAVLPRTYLVDMAVECRRQRRQAVLSERLVRELRCTLDDGRQAIVLLNRRGWSPVLRCLSCGFCFTCRSCDISLTYHRRSRSLRCHYCGHEEAVPRICPVCGRADLSAKGLGTEQLEARIIDAVPGIRTLRVDADTTARKHSHARYLQRFARGEADCLVGTQMVAKGLDFPAVRLVGIVAAERGLSIPEFRAAERTFQLVTQVAGRAGRGETPGLVVVQSFDTEAPAIADALRRRTRSFYERELDLRRTYGYPPAGGLLRILWSGTDPDRVSEVAGRHGERLRGAAGGLPVLGPAPAAMPLLQGKSRWHALIKAPSRGAIQAFLNRLVGAGGLPAASGVRQTYDVDPYVTM